MFLCVGVLVTHIYIFACNMCIATYHAFTNQRQIFYFHVFPLAALCDMYPSRTITLNLFIEKLICS